MHDDMIEPTSGKTLLIAAALIALGLAAGGYFIGTQAGVAFGPAFVKGKLADRVVSVKGLSERAVKADLALWEIKYVTTSDDLSAARAKIEKDTAAITDYLLKAGLNGAEVTPQRVEVTDLMAQQYRPEGAAQSRFIVRASLMVRSANVDLVATLNRTIGDLIKSGVIFANDGGYTGAYFLFTGINDVKLEMIAAATKNARAAAEQFASDSGAHVGGILRANQGQFSILPGDNWPGAMEEQQINKTVRVVATVDYLLGD